jgi:hypothetical protein
MRRPTVAASTPAARWADGGPPRPVDVITIVVTDAAARTGPRRPDPPAGRGVRGAASEGASAAWRALNSPSPRANRPPAEPSSRAAHERSLPAEGKLLLAVRRRGRVGFPPPNPVAEVHVPLPSPTAASRRGRPEPPCSRARLRRSGGARRPRQAPAPEVVAEGLSNPRGMSFGPGGDSLRRRGPAGAVGGAAWPRAPGRSSATGDGRHHRIDVETGRKTRIVRRLPSIAARRARGRRQLDGRTTSLPREDGVLHRGLAVDPRGAAARRRRRRGSRHG